jgi:hypothetical protein
VKIATFFKRQSRKLIETGKLGEEHKNVEQAVDQFIQQMDQHANTRALILEQREYLNKLVKDNPECPKCHTNDKLKIVGTAKNEKGWRSNKYKCRKCNIEFVWNRPNNPWDMIQFIEEVMQTLHSKYEDTTATEDDKKELQAMIDSMQGNLQKLKPVIDAHDKEYQDLLARDEEMARLIHEFKNSLLIEKIKMDTWENRTEKA